MHNSRRDVLKGASAMVALASTGSFAHADTKAGTDQKREKGMAKGLTLLTFRSQGELKLGVKTDKGILHVQHAAKLLNLHAPATMDDLLQQEDGPSLQALVATAEKSKMASAAWLKEDGMEYGPLVSRPEKIVCVGLNYRHHAEEIGAPIPKQPVLFNKFNNTLNHHNGTVKLPVDGAKKFDYEVELVMVIGKQAHNVSEADALNYVAGYATGNDFTARDLQYDTEINSGQWMIGKAIDQFAPLGPYLITAEQVDPD